MFNSKEDEESYKLKERNSGKVLLLLDLDLIDQLSGPVVNY